MPEAIVLVILGVLASLIPQVPNIQLPPDLVLLLFLPPLVYNAAFFSAPRETRENAVPITALAVGATTVTIFGVGAVTTLVLPSVGWAAALAFASAVAPTDAVAATSVLNRLGAPQRIVTIMEGESLINDGVALTAFGLAVEAMAHPFTFTHGLVRLVEVVVGGIAYGLVVAVVIGRVRHFIRDPSIQILVTLITPFIAYVPAEELHVSGVLATVVTGIYLGTRTEGMLQAASRVSGAMFWRTVVFLLESALFVLLGLELRTVVDDLSSSYSVAWLAGAVVVVVTLIGEGLTLAPLLHALGLGEGEERHRREMRARAKVAEAGLARLDQLAEDGEVDEDTANVYRQLFEMRLERVRAALGDDDGDGPADTSGFRAELVRAQRAKLEDLYQKRKISDEIRRSISRSLDLQERRRDGLAP